MYGDGYIGAGFSSEQVDDIVPCYSCFFAEMNPFTVDFGDVISCLEIGKRSGCIWNRFRNLNKSSMITIDMNTQSSEFGIVKIFDSTLVVAPFDVISIGVIEGGECSFDGATEHFVGVFDRFIVVFLGNADSGCESVG